MHIIFRPFQDSPLDTFHFEMVALAPARQKILWLLSVFHCFTLLKYTLPHAV